LLIAEHSVCSGYHRWLIVAGWLSDDQPCRAPKPIHNGLATGGCMSLNSAWQKAIVGACTVIQAPIDKDRAHLSVPMDCHTLLPTAHQVAVWHLPCHSPSHHPLSAVVWTHCSKQHLTYPGRCLCRASKGKAAAPPRSNTCVQHRKYNPAGSPARVVRLPRQCNRSHDTISHSALSQR